ncbi:uncharacterized protein VP01_3017g4 [Puccinia sorghi]|uniref:Uncharacterized protein n=1 Tax=Puccinia sorghi TaxID=27349 RepID=A0A0L6V0A2_9BASI|nr:uncharacterized protein VP01_3017g4 [Puccinia sorghi]
MAERLTAHLPRRTAQLPCSSSNIHSPHRPENPSQERAPSCLANPAVTLEQNTALQHRASIATSSLSCAPPDQQGPTSLSNRSTLPLASETLLLPYKHCQAPASPQARFAENPCNSSSTRLSQSKSVLKFRSPSQLIVPTTQVSTSPGSCSSNSGGAIPKPASSSTAPTSLVVPSSSSERARTTSMISDHDSLSSNPYLYPHDAIHPSGEQNIYHHHLAELDQFQSRERAQSMSDFHTSEPWPQRQPDHQLYPMQQTIALSPHIFCGLCDGAT